MDNYTATSGRAVRIPEVMISYSSQDRDRVMQFVRALRAAGVAVWIDQGGIDGAQRWSEEIVNAIEACRTVLLFISRTSMESQNISREVALAWESGKHFLPVALEEAKIPKSMQYQLAGIQYVKLYEGDPDAKFESVLRALVRLGVRVSPYSMAVISAGMGDRDQTLEWLAKACEEHSGGLSRLKTEPRFNPMRTDPRFADLAKRAESIALDSEDASAEIVLPQPLTAGPQKSTASVPAPAWKRLLWPDIVDAKSAREAAALAVWASAAVIAARWLLSFLVTTTPMNGMEWWNDPIVMTVIFAALGFGVQKMGRPAAVIGTILCALGALFNLNALSFLRSAMESQEQYQRMGQQFSGQPNYSALYYAALFGGVAGIVFVLAFVNAWRGTFAYRALVQARQTQDKQDALSPEDLLAVRRRVMAVVQRVWGKGPLAAAKSAPEAASTAAPAAIATPVQFRAPSDAPKVATQPFEAPSNLSLSDDETQSALTLRPALPIPVLTSATVESPNSPVAPSAVVPTPDAQALDQFPAVDDAPDVHTLADLVGSNPFQIMRALIFLAANVVTGLAFMLARSMMMSGPFHPVYWQFAILHGIAFTLATVLAFRFIRRGWTAAVVAAAVTVLLMLPVCHFTLGTFTIGDLFYREQFQEFLLIPFVDSLVTLLGLFFLIPRIRPLALALWTGSVCAEVATSMLITTLRELGAAAPPDPVLGGTLAFFVGVRSLVFAAVLWTGLRFSGMGRGAAG
jgi:TIR domain